MAVATLAQDLQSRGIRVLTKEDEQFKYRLERWSDVDLKVPSAIVLAETDSDVVRVVEYAVSNNIPFVAKAGGHSLWSTIGEEGFILDLSLMKAIQVHHDTATLQAGVTSQEALDATSEKGFAIATANASNVGMIPLAIQGGNHPLVGGFGAICDSIVSAKVVTAKGLVEVGETLNPDLFWAVKGAGQFFGVVVELTLRIWPLKLLGELRQWMFVYTFEQLPVALDACTAIMEKKSSKINGAISLAAPPPHFKPMILISGQYNGGDFQTDFAPLIQSGAVMSNDRVIELRQITEPFSKLDTKGGHKGFVSAGLQRFSRTSFEKVAKLWLELIEISPGNKKGVFLYNFFSTAKALEVTDSAYTQRDVSGWAMTVIIAEDAESWKLGFEFGEKAVAAFRENQDKSEYSSFPNHTRTAPIEELFRDPMVLKRLKELKKKWDPNGVFTKLLL